MDLTRRTTRSRRRAAGCLRRRPRAAGPCPGGPARRLEAASQQRPRDAGLMTQLGIAYYDAKQFGRARDVLNSALVHQPPELRRRTSTSAWPTRSWASSTRPASPTPPPAARRGTPRQTRRDRGPAHAADPARAPLPRARRDRAGSHARRPGPRRQNAVAVFPFRYVGPTTELRPLGRGLTHMMITDLSKLSRLTLLERERVQALVDELALERERAGWIPPPGRAPAACSAPPGWCRVRSRMCRARPICELDAAVVDASNCIDRGHRGRDRSAAAALLAGEAGAVPPARPDGHGHYAGGAARHERAPDGRSAGLPRLQSRPRGRGPGRFRRGGSELHGGARARSRTSARRDDRRATCAARGAGPTDARRLPSPGSPPGGGFGADGPWAGPAAPRSPAAAADPPDRCADTIPSIGSHPHYPAWGAVVRSRASRESGRKLPETLGGRRPHRGGLTGTIIIIITRP